jgi:hypothetical protein
VQALVSGTNPNKVTCMFQGSGPPANGGSLAGHSANDRSKPTTTNDQ